MSLYCPSPPPLLDGNKVCTGASRVSTDCYDGMATGLCAGQTESDCEAACRKSEACELFVYFPEEMRGSCVLCSDLFNYERTPGAGARAYVVLAARSPPVPPGLSNLAVLPDPSPPSPAVSSLELASPPATYPFLGRHKTGKPAVYVDCTFAPGVEYTTSRQAGYKDGKATTKEECCKQCGHLEMGCTHFIFEPSDGVCVLLPSSTNPAEFETNDNELVISGIASVGIVAAGADGFDASRCSYTAAAGYTTGGIGPARPLPGGIMGTAKDCCRSCGVTQDCAKFTFSERTKACTMYASVAEMVMLNDLTAGAIQSKAVTFESWFRTLQATAAPPPRRAVPTASFHRRERLRSQS
jgi:hypothetical protein